MREQADRTSRHRQKTGSRPVSQRRRAVPATFCSPTPSRNTFRVVTWRSIVGHHRRFTLRAFLQQQGGYGEAESLLRFKHLIFFGPTGTAKWRGQIYGMPRSTWIVNRPVIYHGIFGEGFFQSVYPTPQSEVAAYLRCVSCPISCSAALCALRSLT